MTTSELADLELEVMVYIIEAVVERLIVGGALAIAHRTELAEARGELERRKGVQVRA